MNFRYRQPFVFAAAMLLLTNPLQRPPADVSAPASRLVLQIPTPAETAKPLPAPVPNQKALAHYIASRYGKSVSDATHIVKTTFEEAGRYALPPALLLGMMQKESGFNASAESSYGAMGLMQVVPRFHMERLRKNETESSFKNPRTNIRVAANILAEYLASHKDLDKALKKYSGSSRGYSRQVRSNWHQFEKVGQRGAPPKGSAS